MSDVSAPDAGPTDSAARQAAPAMAESAILKILSGVQAGVEVALSAGLYTLGSGDDDDIRIIDVSLAPRHLELRIAPGANQLRAVAGQVRSGNGLVLEPAGDWHEVEPLDIVTAGTTRFAIAAASAAWTSVTDIPTETPPAAEEAPADGGVAALLRRVFRHLAPAGWRELPVPKLALPVAALALVAGLVLWQMLPGGAPGESGGAAGPADFAQVRSVLSQLDFARDIELRQEVDGVIYATGYVETQAERRAVAAATEATGVSVNLRVWVLQSMHQEIAGLIEAQARNVAVEISRAGAVTLSGLIPDDAQAERFMALVREVPGVSEVDSRLRTPSSLLAQVEQLAQSSQLKPWVLFRLDRGLIEATGALPADEVRSWTDFLQIYARRFAPDIGLRSFVQLQGVNVRAGADSAIGAITIGAREVDAGDVEIDVSRLQGGEVAPAELLVGGGDVGSRPPSAPDRPSASPGVAAGRPGPVVAAGRDAAGAKPLLPPFPAEASDAGAAVPAAPVASGSPVVHVSPPPYSDGVDEADAALPPIVGAILPLSASALPATPVASGLPVVHVSPPHSDGVDEAGAALPPIAGAILPLSTPALPATPAAAGVVSLSGEAAVPALVGGIGSGGADSVGAVPDEVAPSARAASAAGAAPADPGSSGVGESASPAAGALQVQAPGNESSLIGGTRLMLEQWRDGRLQQGASAGLLMGALERLSRESGISSEGEPSRLARQRMHDRYLPAPGIHADTAGACWPASRVRPQDVVTALFWLDILSVGDALSLARFDAANRATLMEVALSPRRVAHCVAAAYPDADILRQSVYLREVRRNPGFIRFVLRDIPPFALDVAGASTAGEGRFILTRAGARIGEGEYPGTDARLLAVGELGAAFETAAGPAALVYGPQLNWLLE